MVLIPASSFQLISTSCRRGYIIIWRAPTSCERHNFAFNATPRQSKSPLIWYLRPDAPIIYTGAFLLLTAWPGRRSICNIRTSTQQLNTLREALTHHYTFTHNPCHPEFLEPYSVSSLLRDQKNCLSLVWPCLLVRKRKGRCRNKREYNICLTAEPAIFL